jgi:hypothetical protein
LKQQLEVEKAKYMKAYDENKLEYEKIRKEFKKKKEKEA